MCQANRANPVALKRYFCIILFLLFLSHNIVGADFHRIIKMTGQSDTTVKPDYVEIGIQITNEIPPKGSTNLPSLISILRQKKENEQKIESDIRNLHAALSSPKKDSIINSILSAENTDRSNNVPINKDSENDFLSAKQKVDSIANVILNFINTQKTVDKNSIFSYYNSNENNMTNTRTIRLIITDISNLDQFENDVIALGAKSFPQIDFKSKLETQLKQETLLKAVDNAKEKIVKLSQQNNFKIGKLFQIDEPPNPNQGFNNITRNTKLIAIRSTVNVTYEIK